MDTEVGGSQAPYFGRVGFPAGETSENHSSKKKHQNEGLESQSPELCPASSKKRAAGSHPSWKGWSHANEARGSRNGRATSLITGQPSPHNRCRPTQTREFGDKGDLNPLTTPDPHPSRPRCGLKGARWHLGPVCHPFLGTGIF